MDSILEKIISEINSKSDTYQKQIKKYLKVLKGTGEKVVDLGKVKLEIKRIEYEINNIYKKIGKYVSKKYIDKDIVDFTYDEIFLEKLEQIKKIKIYLNTLKKAMK